MIRTTTGFTATGFTAAPVLSAPVTGMTTAVGTPIFQG
ncbi:hypothetical protein FHS07_002196 [Microbacterium proteolyticum]|uniref:Uncharacterized protein n=1 Tax=Microbacterium proteolyticum TaxID=1572644 RepID=A0A7W5GG49_9MICO|nr:hypothetical protein [Microbacterium proteolyticum]